MSILAVVRFVVQLTRLIWFEPPLSISTDHSSSHVM